MIDAITANANADKDLQSKKVIKKAVKSVAKIAKVASKRTPTKVKQSNITKKIAEKAPATKSVNGFRAKKLVAA
jgi:hypothetical protein